MEDNAVGNIQLLRDWLFYFPKSYKERKVLKKDFFKESYTYVFQVMILSRKKIGNKLYINAMVFDRKIIIVHSTKLARFFWKGKKIFVCGSLKYQEDFDEEDYKEEIEEDVEDDKAEEDCNIGWQNIAYPKLYCFFPDLFDIRIGLIPRYPKLKPAASVKLKSFIWKNAPSMIKHNLMRIHEPSSVEDLNSSLRELFKLELSCFLKHMNKEVSNEGMPLNPQINLSIKLTESQQKVLNEIYVELSSTSRMSKVLYGDVGSGKTIIAILAALKCVLNNKNVLYLVPTQLLAKQIKDNFQKFVPEVNIALITAANKISKKPIKQPVVFIGTQALLWKEFENIGLVIVDEQHKFGVEQRHILTKDNNLLMMTATMIPRTFQMILMGNLSFAKLESRKEKIKTETFAVFSERWHKVFEEILEIAKTQNVIWVSTTIEKAENNYQFAQKKEANSFLLHSKIKDKDLVLSAFDQSGGGILFSTTVIEVGIDLDLNYIVIEDADKLGLAQLHQIRGRVGRRETQGTCILIGDNMEKLHAIQKAETGLEISQLDLEARGFGLLQSDAQSGFENFVFAREWKNKKWHPLPLDTKIITEAKFIKIFDSNIADLFTSEYSSEKIKL